MLTGVFFSYGMQRFSWNINALTWVIWNIISSKVKFRDVAHVFGSALTPRLLTQTHCMIDDVNISSSKTIQ